MLSNFLIRVFSLFFFLSFFISCSSIEDILKNPDGEFKRKKAMGFYNDGSYDDAIVVFENIMPFYRNTKYANDIYYYLAMANYKLENYIIASYYFEIFVLEYGQDDRAEECMFLMAYCYYLDSPRYNLDQENTIMAIENLQRFVDRYPNSSRVKEANDLMYKLIDKVEYKYYKISLMYYNMQDYKSSIVSFLNVLDDYPSTKYREDIFYYLFMSYYNMFAKSVEDKKEYRRKQMYTYYKVLKKEYPKTKYNNKIDEIIKTNNLKLII